MIKADILKTLEMNELKVFEVMAGLDVDCDVVLKDCDVAGFLKFCDSINSDVVFCHFLDLELEDYLIDENHIRETIIEIVEDKYQDTGLSIEDFENEISEKMNDIQKYNAKVRKKFSELRQKEILFASIYVVYNGMQVGINLYNDHMEGYPMAFEIEEGLEKDILELIEDKTTIYETDGGSRYECWEKEWEQRRIEEKEKREQALVEIRDLVANDASLCNYTNQRLRHAYSKKIAEQYSEKYDVQITIGSVEAVVEECYKRLK